MVAGMEMISQPLVRGKDQLVAGIAKGGMKVGSVRAARAGAL
jgi:hypothetical protein